MQLLTEVGRAFAGRIVDVGSDCRVYVEVVSELSDHPSTSRASRISITLGLAVVKGPSFELALRMATELGIRAVVPLFTARTIVRWDEAPRKRSRYERVAREAAKQCGRLERAAGPARGPPS